MTNWFVCNVCLSAPPTSFFFLSFSILLFSSRAPAANFLSFICNPNGPGSSHA
eukprot:m.9314 g.9314  ORF g.9314 m.9314 type:complete len:53 (-) comp5390_c1_seq1:1588-1746(-)